MICGVRIQTEVPAFVSTLFWNYLFTLNPKGCACFPVRAHRNNTALSTRVVNKNPSPSTQDFLSLQYSISRTVSFMEHILSFYHLPKGPSWNSLGEHNNVYCLKKKHSKNILVMQHSLQYFKCLLESAGCTGIISNKTEHPTLFCLSLYEHSVQSHAILGSKNANREKTNEGFHWL